MLKQAMLTTIDNPYNPFEDFSNWLLYDNEKGYNTCSYLARTINISDDMSEEEVKAETERAIDRIIINDFLNIYKKVMIDEEFQLESAIQ